MIAAAIEAARSGRLVLLLLEDGGGARGDLMVAAEHATPAALNTLLTRARGLLCLALGDERYRRLELRPDRVEGIRRNPHAPREATTIEAAHGVSTGISSADRAQTIRVAASPTARPADVRQPGHVPVLHSAPGGVLERRTPTEAAVDLAVLAGMTPAAVVCDVLDADGETAGREQLEAIAGSCGAEVLPVELLAAQLEGAGG